MFTKLTEFLDSFLDMGIPGYDCIVYKDGECVYRHMNGYSDKENKIPVNGNEKYNIYSSSKPITCTAALQLYEKGLFKLEDKLSDYMPEFKEMYVKTEDDIKKAEKEITIKDLFCMTAGFSYNLNSPELMKFREDTEGKCPTREAMKYLAKEPLLFEPGEFWQYSLCHDVLAALVEVISGQNFNDYVTENIFKPLGMNDSTFLLPYDKLESVAAHYKYNEETKTTDPISKIPSYRLGSEYASGGAGCVSTVSDYIKFLEAMRKGDIILKKETIDLMSTDCLTDSQRETYWNKTTYGYGLGVRCPYQDFEATDFGWGGAAGAHLAIDRKYNFTYFYAQHVLTSPVQAIRGQIPSKLREILENIK